MLTYACIARVVMDSKQQYEREPIVSPSLLAAPSWKSKYKFNPMFDLGISEWMGDTNIESDNTKFLDSIVFDDTLSDERERSTSLVETNVKQTRVVMSGEEETSQEMPKHRDKENIIQGDIANDSDISLARK